MTIKKVSGIEIYVEVMGEGPPLLLHPGFSTNHLLWKKHLHPLTSHFTLIIYDVRGSGKSSAPPPPYTLDLLVEDAAALLKELNIPKAHMMGFSMGSLITQQMALTYPDTVDKCLLITPFATLPEAAKWQLRTTSKLMAMGVDMRVIIETVLPWLYSNTFLTQKEHTDEVIENMLNNPLPQSPEGYLGQTNIPLTTDLTDKLSQIEKPTMILAGEEDLLTPLHSAHQLHKGIKGSILKTVPDMGHMIIVEKPEIVIETAKEFFLN